MLRYGLVVLCAFCFLYPGGHCFSLELREDPLWDGVETVEEYALRAGLEPSKRLDCGNGVSLDLVLIPAGKFVMGVPEPVPTDEEGMRSHLLLGQGVCLVSAGAALAMCVTVVFSAVRRKRKLQYSLGQFIVVIWICSVAAFGGTYWYRWAHNLDVARSAHATAVGRYREAFSWERGAHEITIKDAFYIGKYEVTQAQFQQVMGYNNSPYVGAQNPVGCVPLQAIMEFCKKLADRTGAGVRLPTEAEWEYACRAGTRTNYCSGDSDAELAQVGWYCDNSGLCPHPVGQKAPNRFGLYDMHGNEGEVVQGNLRGGCYWQAPSQCRSASRIAESSATAGGFRVACDVMTSAP